MKAFRRGVSPLIATIILIAITVTVGAAIYVYTSNILGVTGTIIQVEVVSCELVRTGARTVFTITVKNTGNRPITRLQVTIWDQGGTARGPADLRIIGTGGSEVVVSETNPLQPGYTATVTLTDATTPSIGTNYIIGNAYGVRVTAAQTTGGGATVLSSFDKAFTVYCTG